jgi:hypothetical protein
MNRYLVAGLITVALTAAAWGGPAERAGRLDKRLGALEQRGAWEEGSRGDRREDRFDRFEDRLDRREDVRDRAVDRGPWDRRGLSPINGGWTVSH